MKFSVLPTKLHKPQLSDSKISKTELLCNSQWATVILICAQAGSGKSTIVSDWLSKQDRLHIWYSLDEWDNDLTQFFSYLIAGMKLIDQPVSEQLEQLLNAFQSIGLDGFLKAFIHQIHAINHPFILVFDDYQVIQNDQIHQVIRTILDHMPGSLQLVLITREDPPLPLAKLRAGKRLLELRISELRFTEEEVRTFFLQQLNLNLEDEQLKLLFKRTEGWVAGLQLTALSMQGLEDINGFIEAFTGSHYYIMDYLMEEVLERQTPEIKGFLLKTAVLEFFSGELCEAVVPISSGNGSLIIERLVKTNCFIIPMDSSGKWYRYHHLFRDLLRQQLEHQPKIDVENLHLRAGLWFKMAGREQEAVQHFLRAEAYAEAAALIECKWDEMDQKLQSASWLDMAKRLPIAILEKRPVLAMGYGWALLDMGNVEGCIRWLDKAQELYDQYHAVECSEGIQISDTLQFELLPATIAMARGYIAAATCEMESVFKHAKDALRLIPRDQHLKRGLASMMLAVAHWGIGELNEAEAVIVKSLEDISQNENPIAYNSIRMSLGEVYIQQGRLIEASELFKQLISSLSKENQVPIIMASLYLDLAKIAFLRGENKQAYALLEDSKTYGQRCSLINWEYNYYILLARVYCSEGFWDLARDCLRESKEHYVMNPIPDEVSFEDLETLIDREDTPLNPAKLSKEHANQSLSESLTVRELEVLALIASGSSNQEICNTLFLALSTVKGYNQAIYGKLQVKRRTEAVVKAKVLGLV